jgi:hypothetical protein
MKTIKLGMTFLAAVLLVAAFGTRAQSDKEPKPTKVRQKAVSAQSKSTIGQKKTQTQVIPAAPEIKVRQTTTPERSAFGAPVLGYKMVTDILDAFGGASESNNYVNPVSSGGQPSTIDLSQSNNFVVEAGFVSASSVKHGDANSDGAVGAADIVFLLNYLYREDSEPCPVEAGDANCDGSVGAGDLVFLLNYLYKDGTPPAC